MKSDQSIILLGILLILSYALTQLFSIETVTETAPIVVEKASLMQGSDSVKVDFMTQKNMTDSVGIQKRGQ